MARGRKFGVCQSWKVEGKYYGIGIGNIQMAHGIKFGVWQPWKVKEQKKKMERVVIQGMANRESRTCDGNLSRTPDPV